MHCLQSILDTELQFEYDSVRVMHLVTFLMRSALDRCLVIPADLETA